MKTDSQTDIDAAAVRHQADDSCAEAELNRSIIEQALKKFNIPGKITNYTVGPHIIRFEITLPAGVKVRVIEKIEGAIAAEFTENIRILAPIPGSSKVGLEVPRVNRKTISFRSIIEAKAWQDRNDNIPIVIGKDVAGKTVIIDLTKAPHLLIAGTIGTGSTECVNTLIASLLFKFKPDELKLLLIDYKAVAFDQYERVPHLLIPPVNDPDKALSALNQIADEIDQRYKIMAEAGVKNITGFNSNIDNAKNAMPYIVVIANLSMNKNDMELAIVRIAQKGRAAGVHIVVSTQCISPDVVSGVLKAHFQSRICFKVSTEQESLRVLDAKGAETLLGNGDMLLQYPYCTGFKRIQGAVLSDNKKAEIMDLVCNELQKNK